MAPSADGRDDDHHGDHEDDHHVYELGEKSAPDPGNFVFKRDPFGGSR